MWYAAWAGPGASSLPLLGRRHAEETPDSGSFVSQDQTVGEEKGEDGVIRADMVTVSTAASLHNEPY